MDQLFHMQSRLAIPQKPPASAHSPNLVKLIDNEKFADVKFVFQLEDPLEIDGKEEVEHPKPILAHKAILSLKSPIFEAIFDDANTKESSPGVSEVLISDVSRNIFLTVLTDLYGGVVVLFMNSVIPTLKAAQKFEAKELQQKCRDWVNQHLEWNTVCLFLQDIQNHDVNDKELVDRCLGLIQLAPLRVMKSEGWLKLSEEYIKTVIEDNEFDPDEIEIFNACIKWGKHKCLQMGDEECKNLSKVLSNLIPSIRFPSMKWSEIGSTVYASGLLSDKQIASIIAFQSGGIRKTEFNASPRKYQEGRFKIGSKVEIFDEENLRWWKGTITGRKGYQLTVTYHADPVVKVMSLPTGEIRLIN